jgi:hypothetical protein
MKKQETKEEPVREKQERAKKLIKTQKGIWNKTT